jgi:hypothetical protein
MMWLVCSAWAASPASPPTPPPAGEYLPLVRSVAEERRYSELEARQDGRVEGHGRRKSGGNYVAWETQGGVVVRYQKLQGGAPVEDHLFDAAGYPLATVTYQGGAPTSAKIAGHPVQDVSFAGWSKQEVPGATMWLPSAPSARSGGGARVEALGGRVDVWLEQKIDPLSDAFRDGLAAGCGCVVVDRVTAWVDGRLGVRYRMMLPGKVPQDAVDLWAVELPQGTFVLTYTVLAPPDPIAALRAGRAVVAGVDLKP